MSNLTYKCTRHLINDFSAAGLLPCKIFVQDDNRITMRMYEPDLLAQAWKIVKIVFSGNKTLYPQSQPSSVELQRVVCGDWVVPESLARSWNVKQSVESNSPAKEVADVPALKLDEGKPAMSLLPMDALEEVAKCLAFGAEKYGPYNWRKGFDWSRLEAAMLRHYAAYQRGEDRDKESGHLHTAHMAVNALFLLAHQLNGYGKDDRYVGTTLGNT